MDDSLWKRRRLKLPEMETYNREDHWERHFNVKSDVWPVIEYWVSENDFHLVAIKGKRRLYQKGENTNFFVTFLDIRHDGRSVTLISWIHVGWIQRVLSLFLYPPSLEIMPDGYIGIVQRRRACHALNDLLRRLKQRTIVGSDYFHLADLDLTTLCLLIFIVWPQALFLARSGSKMEIHAGLSRELLVRIGQSWGILLALAIAVLFIHHKWVVKKLASAWMKWLSAGVAGLTFVSVTIFLLTQTTSLMAQDKILYHCLYRLNRAACEATLDRLSFREQRFVLERLRTLEKTLAISPKHPR